MIKLSKNYHFSYDEKFVTLYKMHPVGIMGYTPIKSIPLTPELKTLINDLKPENQTFLELFRPNSRRIQKDHLLRMLL